MALTNSVYLWIKKFTYGLLILWVCGISPLIFFEAYSPHRGVQPYPVIIFQQPDHVNELHQALAEIFKLQRVEQWLTYRLFAGEDFYRSAHPVADAALFIPYQGFIWTADDDIPFGNIFSLSGWVSFTAFTGSSAWLPPPEKPPPFSI